MHKPVAILALWACACAGTVSDKDRAAARLRYDIGITSFTEGNRLEALRELLAAVEIDPELADAHHALGLVFHDLGRNDDAVRHYERALALRPDFSEAHNNFGILLTDLGRYDEAIGHFQRALSDILYATPSLAEGNLGWAFYKKGDHTAALQHLRNAVAINPKFCRGYGWLAQIELEQERAEQTVAYCKRYEKHCLQDAATAARLPANFQQEMNYFLGMGLRMMGDPTAARKALAACAAGDSDSDLTPQCQRALRETE